VTDEELRARCHAARLGAHNAQKEIVGDYAEPSLRPLGCTPPWAMRSREYFALLAEVKRRGLSELPLAE
jgi:hypothetical protein